MNICVFGGASPLASIDYQEMAKEVGRSIAFAGYTLIFGGGAAGMMGSAASGALEAGGKVIGILPKFLFEREPPHPRVTDMRVVETMHERKSQMYELADGFIALPGGFGTLEEVMEILTWRQLSLHKKPIFFVGGDNFWDGVRETFDKMKTCGFLTSDDRSLASFSVSPNHLLDMLHVHAKTG